MEMKCKVKKGNAFKLYSLILEGTLRYQSLRYTGSIVLIKIQSTLVISKSKGPSKTRQDIRTSTYQISSIEEKTI